MFLINAASFGAVVFSLTQMRTSLLRSRPMAPRGKGAVRAGLSYVKHHSDIALIMVIVGMVGTFGFNFQITTALMARLEFDKGAGEYGLLGSVMAIGTLGGALVAARREHPRLRLVIGAAGAFGAFSVLAALMPTYWSFAAVLVLVGLSSLTLMTAANATIQLRTAPEYRGRVMALYMAVFMGGTPVGAPIIGYIGETFGPRWTILGGGLVSIATAIAAAVWLSRSRGVRVRYRRHERPRLQVIAGISNQREAARRALASQEAEDATSAA